MKKYLLIAIFLTAPFLFTASAEAAYCKTKGVHYHDGHKHHGKHYYFKKTIRILDHVLNDDHHHYRHRWKRYKKVCYFDDYGYRCKYRGPYGYGYYKKRHHDYYDDHYRYKSHKRHKKHKKHKHYDYH